MNIGRTTNSESFHFNFEIGNTQKLDMKIRYKKISGCYQEVWLNDSVTINNTGNHNSNIKY